jgi:hypothetical protein
MDSSGSVAKRYLEGLGYAPVYEPDGNIPPDFLVGDGQIAVEVRRLNQNIHDGHTFKGLEETGISLHKQILKLLESFGPPTDGKTYFVCYSFGRPLDWKSVKPKVIAAIQEFNHSPYVNKKDIDVSGKFKIRFLPASNPLSHKFVLGAVSDDDSGGFIVAEILENLQRCIAEKTTKINPYREKYPIWWLIFSDHIGRGLDDHDKRQLMDGYNRPIEWEKIILIDARDESNVLVL